MVWHIKSKGRGDEIMISNYISQCAQLAMLLEVSASPKPGNIDRDHDFEDTTYEHFLASAVGVYPIFEKASKTDRGLGKFIAEATKESTKWQSGGNTHFGAFLLLIPLIMAAGCSKSYEEIGENANRIIRKTTSEDAIEFYRAFENVKVRVKDVDGLDVYDESSLERIERENLTFYDIIKISSEYDTISKELISGFEKSFEYAKVIADKAKTMSLNDAIVYTYLRILSRNPDYFIEIKFGKKKAKEVSMKALELIESWDIEKIRDFDEHLIEWGVNPGSTADLIVSSLFLAFLGGLRP